MRMARITVGRSVWSTRWRASRVSPIVAMRLQSRRRRRGKWRKKRRRRRRRRRRRQPPPLPAPPPPPLPAYQRMCGYESRAPSRERPRAATSPEAIASASSLLLAGNVFAGSVHAAAPPCEAMLRARRRLRMAIVPVGKWGAVVSVCMQGRCKASVEQASDGNRTVAASSSGAQASTFGCMQTLTTAREPQPLVACIGRPQSRSRRRQGPRVCLQAWP